MRVTWLFGLPFALAIVSSTVSPAFAGESDPEDKAAAEALFSDARQLMEQGKVPDACLKFSESYRLDQAAGTLLNLALCHEKEGKIASAWAEYRQSVVEARRAGRAEREAIATERAASLEPHLPKIDVVVPAGSAMSGLQVLRNGTPLEHGAWGTPLPVDPGEVLIEARAPLHKPWATKVTLQQGETQSVTVPALEVDEQAVATSPPPSLPFPRKTVAVLVGGAGIVSVGVGAALGVAALASKKDASDACPTLDGQIRCTSQGASDSSRAVQQAWASDITIGVGVAALAVAVVLYVTAKPGVEPAPARATAIDVAPFGPAGAALRLRW